LIATLGFRVAGHIVFNCAFGLGLSKCVLDLGGLTFSTTFLPGYLQKLCDAVLLGASTVGEEVEASVFTFSSLHDDSRLSFESGRQVSDV
jgi:hypothetical protein